VTAPQTFQGSHRRLAWSLICAILCVALSGGWISDAFSGFAPDLLYGLPTMLLIAVIACLCLLWPDVPSSGRPIPARARILLTLLVLASGLWVCAKAVTLMLPSVFAGRTNPFAADMLVVIELGVRQFLDGANPYRIYQVPWDVPLPYGPYLWGPFVLPIALNSDPRMLTLVACLVVPAACIWAAAACVQHGRPAASALFMVLAAATLLHPAAQRFSSIGHTQVYWPLLFVFAWLLRSERWTAAGIVIGCLVVARTTMVSLVPVFLIFLWHRRLLTTWRTMALTAAVVIPFLPFLIADPGALWYALYGSYQKVMKEFVWRTTQGAHTTIGVTGFLLRHHAERFSEVTQAVGMVAVYALAWRAMGRGARPEPWLALALLIFSMTSLWPVIYVYFDVFILIAAALVASVLAPGRPLRHLAFGMVVLCTSALAIVLGAAAVRPGAAPVIDVGAPSSLPFSGPGFERADRFVEGERSYARVSATVGTIRIPRASRASSSVHVIAKGCSSQTAVQRVEAWLNGQSLGSAVLKNDWEDIAFKAPARTWYYGVNMLDLRFISPLVAGEASGSDPVAATPGCAAIDLVKVEP
jgi:hypothetical protein